MFKLSNLFIISFLSGPSPTNLIVRLMIFFSFNKISIASNNTFHPFFSIKFETNPITNSLGLGVMSIGWKTFLLIPPDG